MFNLLSDSHSPNRRQGPTLDFPDPSRTRASPNFNASGLRGGGGEAAPQRLRHGDIVWWHNLKRAGDISAVSEEYAETNWRRIEEDRMVWFRKSVKALR